MPLVPTQEIGSPLPFSGQPGVHNEFQASQGYIVRTLSQTKTDQPTKQKPKRKQNEISKQTAKTNSKPNQKATKGN